MSQLQSPPFSIARSLLLAVQFFTRLPLPASWARWADYSPARMRAAMAHMPAMGWLVGGCAALAFVAARALWGAPAMMQAAPVLVYMLAAVLSVAVTLWLTGCFHEDGLADVADGLGGFVEAERALQIMKDPRVGNYALWAVTVVFALKVCLLAALAALHETGAWCMLLAAHVLSRFFALTLVNRLPHVGLDGQSKTRQITGVMDGVALWPGALWCVPLLGAGLLPQGAWLLGMLGLCAVAAAVVAAGMGRWFQRRLHGFTGDCLGATQQVCELACYATALAVLARLPAPAPL